MQIFKNWNAGALVSPSPDHVAQQIVTDLVVWVNVNLCTPIKK
uniref:Uncharacterized protein n=1 Tax=Anguilla anguilla TaxID=7936 RepID=A0A0E9V7E5_ANGAN